MSQIKHLMSDERGSTLIEVIVSVLIIGIAFVPLMVGLNAALNVNKQTENELYAENVAANVIEVCKTYGTKGLEELISAASGDPTGTKGIAAIFSGASLSGESNSFVISNITSGTAKKFTAEVEFSSWDDKQNDFSGYPSVEGVKNAIVVSFGEDRFDTVFNYFLGKAKEIDTTINVDSLDESEMKKYIARWLKREINIYLEPGADSEGNPKIIVRKEIVYTAENNEIEGRYPFRCSDASLKFPYTTQSTPVDSPVGAYNDIPQMIVMTYKQFKDSNGKNIILDNGLGDDIHLIKSVDGDTYLYALSENGRTLKNSNPTYDVDITPSGSGLSTGEVHVYSNLNLINHMGFTEETTFGTAESDAMSRMKDVTITIKDGTREVAKKTSTMIEYDD